jgi:hypothetical protein
MSHNTPAIQRDYEVSLSDVQPIRFTRDARFEGGHDWVMTLRQLLTLREVSTSAGGAKNQARPTD